MPSLNDIRSTFLDFFASNGHAVVPSSPLVPRNDPTLMFTNSGMVQFKNLFTGVETRDYTRATSGQKCVRAGGKHNDLDNVGYTARHHTFFEMLGNFSFGDYFKDEAIPFAWDLITKEFGISADRLLVTVYHTDDEAAAIWKKYAGLPDERIIRIPTDDNFWMMGPTGPCGPCSEIFYDHGPDIAGGPPGSPGRGRRPVHRDLEPRLHAVRAVRGRHPRATCRTSRSTPAWGWSGSAHCCRASTTITTPTSCAPDRGERACDLDRSGRAGQRAPPGRSPTTCARPRSSSPTA